VSCSWSREDGGLIEAGRAGWDSNAGHEEWIAGYQEGKLLIIDVNNLDFVENPHDFSLVVEKVEREIFGLFS
jgi:hypothetical protein